MGLAWTDQCFCANSYNNGNTNGVPNNNRNQADCPDGECPITDCDADGVLMGGVADLCANGENSCGNRNAVYSLKAATISESTVSTTTESGWTDEETARQFKYQGCFYQYAGDGTPFRGERTGSVAVFLKRCYSIWPLLAELSRLSVQESGCSGG